MKVGTLLTTFGFKADAEVADCFRAAVKARGKKVRWVLGDFMRQYAVETYREMPGDFTDNQKSALKIMEDVVNSGGM